MRVLLADDHNEIRLLAAQQLQRSGHRVVDVGDGEQALRAFDHELFDVVLLDEQMPLMDGIQALRAIRLREQKTRNKIPIIALTGNSSGPDRERLLSAGFDAVLGKPFRLDALAAMLDHLARHGTFPPEHRPPAAAVPFDSDDLLQRVAAGDEKLFRQVIATFLRDLPRRLNAIEKAIDQKRADALASAAHALKSSVGLFGSASAGQLCAQLQELGRGSAFADVDNVFAQLKEEIAKLEANLRGYAGQAGSHRAGTNRMTGRSQSSSTRKEP